MTTTGTGSCPGVPSTTHSTTSGTRSEMTSSSSTQLCPGMTSTSRSSSRYAPDRVRMPTSPEFHQRPDTLDSQRAVSPT
ncbi:hypothetical protein ACFQV2_32445 [Actinokineospora soli]|uniref:Uncharacterized protein n=1 Tax=Actinokineospora soli TaxID=1048753 RepID=A0ABW2TYA9_9PSEU